MDSVIDNRRRLHLNTGELLICNSADHFVRERIRQDIAVVLADFSSNSLAGIAGIAAFGRAAVASGNVAVVHADIAVHSSSAVSAVAGLGRSAVSADNRSVISADVSDDASSAVATTTRIGCTSVATLHDNACTDVDDDSVLRTIRDLNGRCAVAAGIASAAVASLDRCIPTACDDCQHRRLAVSIACDYHNRRHSIAPWRRVVSVGTVSANNVMSAKVDRHLSEIIRDFDRQISTVDVVRDRHRPPTVSIRLDGSGKVIENFFECRFLCRLDAPHEVGDLRLVVVRRVVQEFRMRSICSRRTAGIPRIGGHRHARWQSRHKNRLQCAVILELARIVPLRATHVACRRGDGKRNRLAQRRIIRRLRHRECRSVATGVLRCCRI